MESSITNFCKPISSFLTHIESSSKSLADSIQRRPIPLELASSSFLGRLDAGISAAASDLARLDNMAFGTVSFEELIGHCDQIYKMSRAYVSEAEDRLKCYGYVPETVVNDKEGLLDTPRNENTQSEGVAPESVLFKEKITRKIDNDDFFRESMSLKNIGLSDACLATIASEGKQEASHPKLLPASPSSGSHNGASLISTCNLDADEEEASCPIRISKDDYDKLPSYMKSLASFEDLLEAVAKLNPVLKKQGEGNNNCSFCQEDLELLGFGRKGKTYVLMLLKMNRLTSETVDEAVLYSVI